MFNFCKKSLIAVSFFLLVSCSGGSSVPTKPNKGQAQIPQSEDEILLKAIGDNPMEETFSIISPNYTFEFSTKGACVKQIYLNKFKENGDKLPLIINNTGVEGSFLLYPGKSSIKPLLDTFKYTIRENEVVFERDYEILDKDGKGSQQIITLRKTFVVGQKEYMNAIRVEIIPQDDEPLKFGTWAYTIGFEPQIAPAFLQAKKSIVNYRNFYLMRDGKTKRSNLQFSGNLFTYESPIKWLELTSQYFTCVMIPKNRDVYTSVLRGLEDRGEISRIMLSQKTNTTGNGNSDIFYFYAGPQLKDCLNIFESERHNSYGLSNLNLNKALEGSDNIVVLQNLLKWIMSLFYKIIPNWGVSILFLTLLIKILLFPLTLKSMRNSAKMAIVQKEFKIIQEKYKDDDPDKFNKEVFSLYKRYGIRPATSIIPTLIQLPILLSMFSLIQKHFELRGAVFIPGWIDDLSGPDTLSSLTFQKPIWFLGNSIHILPFIYCATMILSILLSQNTTTATQSDGMKRFFVYGMPILLFFALYNTSSGLLVYWTFSNILGIIQQIIINKFTTVGKQNAARDVSYTNITGDEVKLPPKAKRK